MDLMAGALAFGLLVIIGIQWVAGSAVPDSLDRAFWVSLTWTFRGGVQYANGAWRQNRSNNGR